METFLAFNQHGLLELDCWHETQVREKYDLRRVWRPSLSSFNQHGLLEFDCY